MAGNRFAADLLEDLAAGGFLRDDDNMPVDNSFPSKAFDNEPEPETEPSYVLVLAVLPYSVR